MHLGLCHEKIEWNFLCVLMCSIFIPNKLGVTAADGLFTEELSNLKHRLMNLKRTLAQRLLSEWLTNKIFQMKTKHFVGPSDHKSHSSFGSPNVEWMLCNPLY